MEMSRWGRRAMIGLLLLTLVSGGANLWATYDQVGASHRSLAASITAQARVSRRLAVSLNRENRIAQRLRREVRSECAFNGDLGGVPVADNPATRRPSLLGLKIVSDSRVAWHRAGCPGRLVRPSRSFAKWARFYHLPVR